MLLRTTLKKLAVTIFAAVFVLVSLVPAEGALRSVRTRVISETPDVTTTQYAKISPSTLLNQSILRVVINNDDEGEARLKIVLSIDIDSDITEWDGIMEITLLRTLAAGENFTIDNATIMDDIDGLIEGGFSFENFSSEFGPEGSTSSYPGGLTGEDFDFSSGDIDPQVFLDLLNLPEGDYTMAFTIYEVVEGADVFKKEHSVTFKVVNIGNVAILSTPTVLDPEVAWFLPQVPIYSNDDYKTYSTVTIKGKDVNFTRTITHAEPSGTGLKGYPGGTDNGNAVLDLSSSDLNFRMGESYSLTIAFKDWNGASISEQTQNFSFSSSAPVYYSPAGGTQVDELQPTFEWAFDAYDPWVDTYSLIIKNNTTNQTTTIRNITDNYYTLDAPLAFGSSYSWHVVPYYTSDGAAFYATPPATASFSTIAHTAPEVTLSEPAEGNRLLAGESYVFSVSFETFNDASVADSDIVWLIGGSTYIGESITYTPADRYPDNSLEVSCTVTDSAGGTATATTSVTVLVPEAAVGGGNLTRFASEEASFSIDEAGTRDADRFEWTVTDPDGDTETDSGSSISVSFTKLGTYTVTVAAFTEDSYGNEKEVSGNTVSVTVSSQGAPTAAFVSPRSQGLLRVDETVPFTVSLAGPNAIAKTVWSINGEETEYDGAREEISFTPDASYLQSGQTTGTVTVTCQVEDEFGDSSVLVSRNFLVIEPGVSFINISEDSSWSLGTPLNGSLKADFAQSTRWYVDGNLQPRGSSYNFSTPGEHTLKAEASWLAVDSSGGESTHEENTEFSIYVKDSVPPTLAITSPENIANLSFITGVEYTFIGSVVSDSQITRRWWTFGSSSEQETDESGLVTYQFDPGTTGSVKASFYAQNTDDVTGKKEVNLTVLDPTVTVQWPSQTTYPAAAAVPVFGTASAGTLYWSIEGDTSDGDSVSQEYRNSIWDRKFVKPGTYTITPLVIISAASPSGGTEDYTRGYDDSFEVAIYSTERPTITAASPAAEILRQRKNEAIAFSLEADSLNGTPTVSWTVLSSDAEIASESGTGSFSYAWENTGVYTVKATAVDDMGLSRSKSWSVSIIDPQLVLTYPEAGKVYGDKSFEKPSAASQNVSSVQFILDGETEPKPANFDWGLLSAGPHTLRATGNYTIAADDSGPETNRLTSEEINFTISELLPPVITLTGIRNNDRLLADTDYAVSAEVTSLEGTDIKGITWTADGTEFGSGTDADFNSGTARGTRTIRITAVDDFDLVSTVTISVKVIDPSLQIILPEINGTTGVYPAETAVTLLYTGQDIEEVAWSFGGTTYQSNMFRLPAGSFTMSAFGSINARLEDGSLGTYTIEADNPTRITAYGQPKASVPTVSPGQSLSGTTVAGASTIAGNPEAAVSADWLLDGVVISSEKPADETIEVELSSPTIGQHTLQIRVTDIFGRVSTEQTTFSVFQPLEVAIESPRNGDSFGPDAAVALRAKLLNEKNRNLINRLFWKLGDNEISGSDFFSGVIPAPGPGEHILSFGAEDIFGETTTVDITFSVQSDLLLSLLYPKNDITVMEGSTPIFRVSAQALSSDVPIDELAENITWYVDDTEAGTGTSLTFSGYAPDSYELQARYDVGEVSRETRSVNVTVEEIQTPEIVQPDLSQTVYYSIGQSIPLKSAGYDTAAYTWILDGTVIGKGRNLSFSPNGMVGAYPLELQMDYQGVSKSVSTIMQLQVNTPPEVTIITPPIQYMGDTLEWILSAIDLEDGTLAPQLYLDGTPLAPDASIVFTEEDLGQHELRASVVDSMGSAAQQRQTFTVKRGIEGVEIISPLPSKSYVSGMPLVLHARILGDVETAAGEELTWQVQYLDAVNGDSSAAENISGEKTEFTPRAPGSVRLEASYTHAETDQTYTAAAVITVDPEPVTMSLYWPHGELVAEETQLMPEILGLSEERMAAGELEWLLDGQKRDFGILAAPAIGGEHSLAVRFIEGDTVTARDQVLFNVNERPKVTILSPAEGSYHEAGSPIIFTAQVEDDQPASGTIEWIGSGGNGNQILGTGTSIAVQNLPADTYTVKAVAADQFGLQNKADSPDGTDVTGFTVFTPVRVESISVNNNIGTYLLTSGSPIPLAAAVTGGVDPSVQWRLKQLETVTTADAATASLTVDDAYKSGPASVRLTVTDRNLVVFVQDFSLNFADTAEIAVTAPAADEPLWAASEQLVQIQTTGFSDPAFTAFIKEEPVGILSQTPLSMTNQLGFFALTIDSSSASSEGIYELKVTAAENGLSKTTAYTMNVFAREPGILITGVPEQLDLIAAAGPVDVLAEPYNITPVGYQWFTTLAETPVGTESSLDLTTIGLEPGIQRISVQALDASSAILAEESFTIPVLGEMTLLLSPADESVTIQQNGETRLEAVAADRNGEALEGESIHWSSHTAGEIGTGVMLQPGLLALQPGEHFITAEATGTDGSTKASVIKVLIRGKEVAQGTPPETGETDDKEKDSGRRKSFGDGEEIGGGDDAIPVSTVTAARGNVTYTRGLSTDPIKVGTILQDTDKITIGRGNAQVTLVNDETPEIDQVIEGSGSYIWDADASSWVSEE